MSAGSVDKNYVQDGDTLVLRRHMCLFTRIRTAGVPLPAHVRLIGHASRSPGWRWHLVEYPSGRDLSVGSTYGQLRLQTKLVATCTASGAWEVSPAAPAPAVCRCGCGSPPTTSRSMYVEGHWSLIDFLKIPEPAWDGDCLRWGGTHTRDGYGQFKRNISPHRMFWELFNGPIPDKLTIDHVAAWGCRHRDCIRLTHMEVVPQSVNTLRSRMVQRNLALTHCPAGHEYTPENLVRRNTRHRDCKTCHRDRERARQRKLREAVALVGVG